MYTYKTRMGLLFWCYVDEISQNASIYVDMNGNLPHLMHPTL